MSWNVAEYEAVEDEFENSGVAERRLSLFSPPISGPVLEVGAGIGATWRSGAYDDTRRFPRVVLVEPDQGFRTKLQERIREASKCETPRRTDHIEVVDAKLPHLGFKDEEFDVVGIFYVLSHVDTKEEAVKEMARVLRKGGRLVMMDHGSHYRDHSGNIKEFTNAPPVDCKIEESHEAEKTSEGASSSVGHEHGYGSDHAHLDQPATSIVDFFVQNPQLEIQGAYEEFHTYIPKFGHMNCIQATFIKK